MAASYAEGPLPRPAVGAIRWDAWTGGKITNQVEKTLGPEKYHDRLPWFAEVLADHRVRIDGSPQSVMDREIELASNSGLDYWAFLLYAESSPMSMALGQYLKSDIRKRLQFCLILHNTLNSTEATWPKEKQRAIDLLKNPGYQKVLNDRPLVYAFIGRTFPFERFSEFLTAAKKEGLNPYCIFMGWQPVADFKKVYSKGFDAVSSYAIGGSQARFSELAERLEKNVWQSAADSKVPFVPLVTTGWDKRPRQDNPVSWETGHAYHKQKVFPSEAKPTEIAAHLNRAINFVKSHPKVCKSNCIIVYAWNEFDEGGWLAPTRGRNGQPFTRRLDAIRKVLVRDGPQTGQNGQRNIPRVEGMPQYPSPYFIKDWRKTARNFDQLAFGFQAKGEHLPLIWLDESRINMDRAGFGLPSYVGPKDKGQNHEAITTVGSVLGATFAGIDKTEGTHNWVLMCEQYFNKSNGLNLVLNRMNTSSGASFWYDIFPHIIFYALADRYPDTGNLEQIVKVTADRWYEACREMGGKKGVPHFDYTGFNFKSMKPQKNGRWTEPDAAAGIAWLQYMAWVRFNDKKYLQAADWCMQFLHERNENPYYEVQVPFGAYIATRMNAELGREYDLERLINWSFDHSSTARRDFGVISANWSGIDCHGLVGAINRPPWRRSGGGYAFAMNTFCLAWPMVPLVRYDDRYARAIGKWMLHAANAARLFYSDAHLPERQSCPYWKGDPDHSIAYEGLRHYWDAEETLYASGDPVKHKWGYKTDYGIYGSAFSGVFGGIIRTTNVKYILQLDCLATESFPSKAFPTFLYFNPYDETKEIEMDVGLRPCDLYDTTNGSYVRKKVTGKTSFPVAADSAALIVVAPSKGKLTREGHKTLIDGVVVDYQNSPN